MNKSKANGLLGEYNGVQIYLIYDPNIENILDFKSLKKMDKENSKVVYADSCQVSAKKLKSWNCKFKQIPYEVET